VDPCDRVRVELVTVSIILVSEVPVGLGFSNKLEQKEVKEERNSLCDLPTALYVFGSPLGQALITNFVFDSNKNSSERDFLCLTLHFILMEGLGLGKFLY